MITLLVCLSFGEPIPPPKIRQPVVWKRSAIVTPGYPQMTFDTTFYLDGRYEARPRSDRIPDGSVSIYEEGFWQIRGQRLFIWFNNTEAHFLVKYRWNGQIWKHVDYDVRPR